jgi:hypothetical protein
MGGRFSRRRANPYDPYNVPFNDPIYPDIPPPGYGGPLNRYGTGFGGGYGGLPPPYGYQRRGYNPMGGFDDPYETYGYGGGYMTDPYESLGPYGRGPYGGRYSRGKFY